MKYTMAQAKHMAINKLRELGNSAKESTINIVFENACDCLYYGEGKKHCDFQTLNAEAQDVVWHEAFMYMANSET